MGALVDEGQRGRGSARFVVGPGGLNAQSSVPSAVEQHFGVQGLEPLPAALGGSACGRRAERTEDTSVSGNEEGERFKVQAPGWARRSRGQVWGSLGCGEGV